MATQDDEVGAADARQTHSRFVYRHRGAGIRLRPRGRVLGGLYSWYFTKVLPRIGQVLSRSKESAYQYLPESVMRFPDGDELADKLRAHGLTAVTFTPFTFGVATLYVGTKPAT